ncbi:type IV pilin-like G/H family protein [Leptolyngbya sp. GB1-A1]|uniref:type IV pilin-like G/H family protein n=1 Tax=Leptolyngbya sp. GB1-A1 TaxID=2933908 RepID=UPI0032998C60
MVTSNSLDLAKQGNPAAIAALMNKSLQSKGITITATASGRCLTLIAEANTAPEKSTLIDFIRQGVSKLNPEGIDRVVVQAKATGKKQPEWREGFGLSFSSNSSTHSKTNTLVHSSTSTKPTSLSVNRLPPLLNLANTILLTGIFLALVAGLLTSNRSKPMLWEYRVEGVEDSAFDYTMQQLGAEGWELTSARRAVSGEGESSRGVYEVILKRQITEAQARQNLEELEKEMQALKLQSKQISAKSYLSSINRAQQANYLFNDQFSPTLAGLDLGFTADEEDYTFAIALNGTDQAIATATSKSNELKSYTGAVAFIDNTTKTIICETDSPATTPPATPVLNGIDLQCAADSSEID